MERGEEPVGTRASSGGRRTVLLVEDDADAREASAAVLDHLGYRVLTAGTGEEALAQWEAARAEIALVLTDLMTPGLGGEEVWRALRARGADVPIVVLSGYAPPSEPALPGARGVAAWLRKPIGIDELGAALGRALSSTV